ncbi:YbhB/YbcL family Raf kinase inhibitor-like protein [Methanococcoides burtonii]|uniref:Phosphatidylethanolamine-binding protein n=1 Tax=Methanococcoides burtonii (strain DSM 6242 / NBRC 107633 / OCM 468 / ACE-M) TaxID=259564 RepID=Q12X79_METBU|nr:YbhB/YbcL family Raf kinase inhibitor-like protein [Methanococcoides burtonii]ABE51947.1 Phosphatidylethanolamine-binding protein [Methanococcoides burtonii DSM 6242]
MRTLMKIVALTTMILTIAVSGCATTDTDEPEPIPEIIEDENNVPEQEIFLISTSAFENNGEIPSRYTCDGDNINPELVPGSLPEDTVSLVLIVDDPDAPIGTFTHWIVWNIAPGSIIEENTVPGIQGLNGAKGTDYLGPCPPSGTHRYFFRFYALDTMLDIGSGSTRTTLEEAMQEHIIAEGELMGTYSSD